MSVKKKIQTKKVVASKKSPSPKKSGTSLTKKAGSVQNKKSGTLKTVPSKKTTATKKANTLKPSVKKKVSAKKPKIVKPLPPKKVVIKKSPSDEKPAIVKTESIIKNEKTATPVPETKPIVPKKIITNAGPQAKFTANYNRADMFYKNTLKATINKRYVSYTEEDKSYLDKKIDLSITINDKQHTIIEKSIEKDWGEVYIEMFRKFPDEKGWVYESEAEYLAYFFPGRVFWVKLEYIKDFCERIYDKVIESGIFKEFMYSFPNTSGKLSKAIKINTKTYSLNFYQICHVKDGVTSCHVGIIMPFMLLMDFHIDFKIYKL